ncbi:hypothetical protein [Winogradskyella aurantiaca]|nr:hypothetical protein [Winogradskyella aurantiaca]
MKQSTKNWIMVGLAAITIFGLVTGKYLFLVFILPISSLYRNIKN